LGQELYDQALAITRKGAADFPYTFCTGDGLNAYFDVMDAQFNAGNLDAIQLLAVESAAMDACLEAGLIGEAVGGAHVDFSRYYHPR